MRNLAGVHECDEHIRAELTRCGIEVVYGERSDQEVAASITGRLGAFTFQRAWYYWIVEGPMPLDAAMKLYADPVGKTDIRVNGHCGCPAPGDPGGRPRWVTQDGRTVASLNSRRSFEECIAHGTFHALVLDEYVFSDDPAGIGARAFIDSYHVDSELGLTKLVTAIRELPGADHAP